MRDRRAFTLIELMLSLAIVVVLLFAMAYAFAGAVTVERRQVARQQEQARQVNFEQRVRQLLTGSFLSEDTADTHSFFVAETEGDGTLGAERITFTTTTPPVPLATFDSTDDFETQHTARGPVGGLAEVSLSLTPVGDSGGQTGLIERLQRPSDGDITQGGTERVLTATVTQIGFEFYNGEDWTTEWDTRSLTSGRLPAAVRVSYVLEGEDASTPHQFLVTLPTSDVTAQDPVTVAGGTN